MKKLFFSLLMMIGVQASFAQTLEKMQWFNEPEQWEIKDKSLSMFVTPQSDYWRISLLWMTPLSIMQRMAVNLKLK